MNVRFVNLFRGR